MSQPFDYHLVPEYMRGGIIGYICFGIVPGDFLCAVIKNDLHECALRADENNMRILHIYACVLHNVFPIGSCKGQENMDSWVETRKKNPLEFEQIKWPDSWVDQVNQAKAEYENG